MNLLIICLVESSIWISLSGSSIILLNGFWPTNSIPLSIITLHNFLISTIKRSGLA